MSIDNGARGMAAAALGRVVATPAAVTGDATLSAAQSDQDELVITGTLTAHTTVTLSGPARAQTIENATTGAYDLAVKRGAAGVALVIPQGETVEVR
jgi:hypothetical protein